MNNDASSLDNSNSQPSSPSSTPPTTPIGSQAQPGVWVPQAEYNEFITAKQAEATQNNKLNSHMKKFHILLAIGGLLLFILYMGMLLWPGEVHSKGNCTAGFEGAAFYLNPIAYLVLVTAASYGMRTKHAKVRILSILIIIGAPIGWFLTGIAILGPILCGV